MSTLNLLKNTWAKADKKSKSITLTGLFLSTFAASAELVSTLLLASLIASIQEDKIVDIFNIKLSFTLSIIIFTILSLIKFIWNFLIIKISNKLSIFFTSKLVSELINENLNITERRIAGDVSSILLQSGTFNGGYIQQLFVFSQSLSSFLMIVIATVLITPVFSIISIFTITIIYLLLTLKTKLIMRKTSKIAIHTSKIINNISKLILDQKHFNILSNKNDQIYEEYLRNESLARKHIGLVSIWSNSPKNLVELVGIFTIFTLALIIGSNSKEVYLIAIAFYKLGPLLQAVYSSANAIRSNQKLSSLIINYPKASKIKDFDISKKNITFIKSSNYSNKKENPFINIEIKSNKIIKNFSICKNELIGISGDSGAGKSNLIKILSGLYTNKNIKVFCEGVPMNKKLGDKSCMLINQYSKVQPTTIIENITMDLTKKEIIDKSFIKKITHICCIDDFIPNTKKLFQINLTDNNGGLSGGQIQRILLARSLYQNPKLLFIDEAFSGIDSKTTRIILERIRENLDITLVLVSHRNSEMNICDKVIKIN